MAFTALHWMSPPDSSAKLFPFLTMQGALQPTRPTFDREVRAGVNGIALWLTGSRGEPFSITTALDCANTTNAGIAFAAYHASIAQQRNLYCCSTLWGPIVVHNVVMESITTFKVGGGGIQGFTGGNGVLLRVNWTIESLHAT